MPSKSPAYRRKRSANHKRNNARRAQLMRQGLTREEAQAIINADGAEKHAKHIEIVKRQKAERASRERTDDVHR